MLNCGSYLSSHFNTSVAGNPRRDYLQLQTVWQILSLMDVVALSADVVDLTFRGLETVRNNCHAENTNKILSCASQLRASPRILAMYRFYEKSFGVKNQSTSFLYFK